MGRVKEITKNATVKCVKTMCSATGWTAGFTMQGIRFAADLTKKAASSVTLKSRHYKNTEKDVTKPLKEGIFSIKKIVPKFIKKKQKDAVGLYESNLLQQAARDISDEQPSKRYNAIMSLSNIGTKLGMNTVSKPLIEALKDSNGNIRSQACKVLVDLKVKGAVGAITLLLNDNNPRVRLEALRGINKLSLDASSIIHHLINATKDQHREIRKRAATYLGWTENETAVNSLIRLLSDQENIVRETAVLALGELRSRSAVSPLINSLNDKNNEVREMAVYTLRELTGQNFEYDSKSQIEERNKSIDEWNIWWTKNSSTFETQKRSFVVPGESTLEYWERIKKEELDRKTIDEKTKRDAEEKSKKEAEKRAEQVATDKAKSEAEEKAKKDSEEKIRKEAEARAREEDEKKAEQVATDKAKSEAESKKRNVTQPKKKKAGTLDKKKLREQMGAKLKSVQAKLDKSKKSREGHQKKVNDLKDKMSNLENLLSVKKRASTKKVNKN